MLNVAVAEILKGSSIWHLCGLMIRQCLELGLHRQQRPDEKSTPEDELKKRLFWSIYHLERRIALVLGRPLTIADDEIDISMPRHLEEDNDESSVQAPVVGIGTLRRPEADITFHCLLLKLDQLNSKSRLAFSRLGKVDTGVDIERKIAKRFKHLEAWRTTIFRSAGGGSEDQIEDLTTSTPRTTVQTPMSQPPLPEGQRLGLLLSYHRARRLLLQAMLTDIHRPGKTFPYASFAKSSGEVCQLNRRLHRLKPVPFTLLDLHSVFVAGFSMIYCVWKDPQLYSAEMAADFGACTTVLYLIAEQWGAGAKKYRDAFELVAEKTAEYVLSTRESRIDKQQSRTSTSQQTRQSGPPAINGIVAYGEMQHQNDSYGVEKSGNDCWANDSFDVWQMINQSVQTQSSGLEYDAVDFTGIEEFLAEEGLGWFNGGTAMDSWS